MKRLDFSDSVMLERWVAWEERYGASSRTDWQEDVDDEAFSDILRLARRDEFLAVAPLPPSGFDEIDEDSEFVAECCTCIAA